ncbi:MAG: hypothetical protein II008_04920 [Oscillospiraceae bacterium]|jgi:hypothetical protein|nr:hypothetical protein [Oscillospiraceae bacterium]
MRSFLRLHQSGKARFLQGGSGLVLINPDQIQAVFSVDEDGVGSYIYLTGEEDALMVDETVEDIDRLVALS